MGILNEDISAVREQVNLALDYYQIADDEEVLKKIEREVENYAVKRVFSLKERLAITHVIFNSIRRLDILQPLIEDDEVNEIMINGYQQLFIEKRGVISKLSVAFESQERLEAVIQKIVSHINRVVNEASPIVDARLKDGSRVNIVLYPIALNGPVMTIRKFPAKVLSLNDLMNYGTLNEKAATFLKKLVVAKYNLFICGGTSSGKTTLLNALAGVIPKDERLITIEDSAELQIVRENLIRLETRNVNCEGRGEVSMEELIKTSLRMRPDRIIVGEVRGKECFSMLQAMNTGHDGSLSTGHANSIKDMLSRLEAMVLMGSNIPIEAARRQIVSALEIFIHTAKLQNGKRAVIEISELIRDTDGEIKFNVLFEYSNGSLVQTDHELINSKKLCSVRC